MLKVERIESELLVVMRPKIDRWKMSLGETMNEIRVRDEEKGASSSEA